MEWNLASFFRDLLCTTLDVDSVCLWFSWFGFPRCLFIPPLTHFSDLGETVGLSYLLRWTDRSYSHLTIPAPYHWSKLKLDYKAFWHLSDFQGHSRSFANNFVLIFCILSPRYHNGIDRQLKDFSGTKWKIYNATHKCSHSEYWLFMCVVPWLQYKRIKMISFDTNSRKWIKAIFVIYGST